MTVHRSGVGIRARLPQLVAAGVLGVAGCCPPPEPGTTTIITIIVPAAPPPKPVPAVARVATPDVKPATTSDPAGEGTPLGRDSLEDQRPVAPVGPKTEIAPPPREPPALPTEPRVTLPEGVVLKLLETGKPLFLRCLKKAAASDPSASSLKVRVHVELDEQARVTTAKADTTDPELASCVERAVHWLTFPVTGKLVVVELPLFYRVE